MQALRESFQDAMDQITAISHGASDISAVCTTLLDISKRGRKTKGNRNFFQSLQFESMPNRQSEIVEPYPGTMEWIFDGNTAHLRDWLSDGRGIYWITGKAGLGKPTLMKFVYLDVRTKEALEEWEVANTLVICGYFFATAVTGQKVDIRQGLLRTLLFQALRQRPSLIPHCCPARSAN